jgi:predicted Zn-dependent peptidase
VFPGHTIGRETLGSRDTIETLERDAIAGFHDEHYRAANLVVAAAGDLHHDDVVAAVVGSLGDAPLGARPERVAPEPGLEPLVVVERPNEQVHVAFGWRALPQEDPDRYAFYVANHVLGGGMSSRLFQEIREERGLAYSVYSSMSSYSDVGLAMIYAGTAPKHLAQVLDVLDDTLDELLATASPTRSARGPRLPRGLVAPRPRGQRQPHGSHRRFHAHPGRDHSIAEHLERIRSVTPDQVQAVLRRVFVAPRTVAAVGRSPPTSPPCRPPSPAGRADPDHRLSGRGRVAGAGRN